MTDKGKQSGKPTVINRLTDIISKMPEGEQYALLDELEERFQRFKREHHRKPVRASVVYSIKGRSDNGLIQNISAGGVFMETRMPFRTEEDISLNFTLSDDPQYQVKIEGRIVRVTPHGVGVAFKPLNEEQKALIISQLEILDPV